MIKIEKLNFTYSLRENILEKVDLKIEPGKIYGLIGKNGSGKTTLMRLIMNYLPTEEQSIKERENLKKAYVPAEVYFPKFLKHKKLVKESIKIQTQNKANMKKHMDKYYSILNINQIKKYKSISSLSSGMQKKIAIGLILANDYDLYLFDEPTILLDISTKKDFFRLIKKLSETGKTVIVLSHVLEELETYVDDFIIVNNKKIKLKVNNAKNRKEIKETW